MLPINEISALYDAIWRKDLFLIHETNSKYASKLYLRFLMNTSDIDKVESLIDEYCLYRYGGKLKLDKDDFNATYSETTASKSFHSTYKELLNRIYVMSHKNEFLMKQLKTFYENSVVNTISGKKLLKLLR